MNSKGGVGGGGIFGLGGVEQLKGRGVGRSGREREGVRGTAGVGTFCPWCSRGFTLFK